mgnify:FL=1
MELPLNRIKRRTIKYTLNGEQREYQVNNYKILLNDNKTDLRAEVDEGDRLVIEEQAEELLTMGDIIEEEGLQDKLEIIFNGKRVEAPTLNQRLFKNGQQASKADLVEPRDEIEVQEGGIRLNQLLNHINYEFSDLSAGKLRVQKNGENVNFTENLVDGDEVEVQIENNLAEERQKMEEEIAENDSLVQLKEKLNQKMKN